MTVYGDLLRAMLADQLAFIADPTCTSGDHRRQRARVTRMSVQATAVRRSAASAMRQAARSGANCHKACASRQPRP